MKCCVIGLGTFGQNLSLELARLGAEVLAVDYREENISLVKDEVADARVMDFADTTVLEKLSLREMDAVVVAIGDNFEQSLCITIKAQELKARRVICRVLSPVHERLLSLLKVDRLVVPEKVAAHGLAHSLLMRGVVDGFEMGDGYSVIEAKVPGLQGGSLREKGEIFKKADVRIVTIKRVKQGIIEKLVTKNGGAGAGGAAGGGAIVEKRETLGVPALDEVFQGDDVFVLFGREKKLRAFLEEYGPPAK
jgi:trk system potassium uptake protein TrkA